MGMMYACHIRQAADHILEVLCREARIRYSRFYDGTDETRSRLIAGMKMSESDADWFGAEGIMDVAAAELQTQGYVKITWLTSKLSDGEPDYEIELLQAGRDKLNAGKRPTFHDLDL